MMFGSGLLKMKKPSRSLLLQWLFRTDVFEYLRLSPCRLLSGGGYFQGINDIAHIPVHRLPAMLQDKINHHKITARRRCINQRVDLCDARGIALGAGARFVARSVDTLAKHLGPTFVEAREHRGAAFIEVLQNCPVFHDGAWDHVKDRSRASESMLMLEHGKPMLFGDKKGPQKGLRLRPNSLELEVVTVGEGGVTEYAYDPRNLLIRRPRPRRDQPPHGLPPRRPRAAELPHGPGRAPAGRSAQL